MTCLAGGEDTTCDLNSAPRDDCVAAESEETDSAVGVSYTSLNVPWFLEDTNCKQIPGPRDAAEVTKNISASTDVIKIDLEFIKRTHAAKYSGDSVQNRNTEYEDGKGTTREEDQPQEVPIASKKQQRRGWKGVRRPICHLFYGLFCCLPTAKKGGTTPR